MPFFCKDNETGAHFRDLREEGDLASLRHDGARLVGQFQGDEMMASVLRFLM